MSRNGQSIISKVRELSPAISRRAAEIEQNLRIPDDLVRDLTGIGCFRLLAPASHGGAQADLSEVLFVIEELSRADASTGWIVGQAASAQLVLSHFPIGVIDRIYSVGPDVIGAGAVAPKGRAVRGDSGWSIKGQWPFVTGAESASWIYVQCMLVEDRKIQVAADAFPQTRVMLLSADDVEIVRTWEVAGMRSTASHDVRVAGALCPCEHSTDLRTDRPPLEGAIFRIPAMEQGGLYVAAAAAGIARGALEDISELARGKRPAFSGGVLADSHSFQERFGEAHMILLAARALLEQSAACAWRAALDCRGLPVEDRAVLRATVAQVTASAARVVDTAYSLAGGTAVYNRCSLQRRFRDIHTLTQHAYAGPQFYSVLGAIKAGKQLYENLF